MLNFGKRNLYRCSAETKCLAYIYISIVRPLLEYGSAIWDPYLQKDIRSIEMVQRRAARWVKSDYRYNNSVTSMLEDLPWHHFNSEDMWLARIKLFYNIVNSSSVLSILNYFTNTAYISHSPPCTTVSILKFLLLEQIIINSAFTPNLSMIGIIYLLTLLNPNLFR